MAGCAQQVTMDVTGTVNVSDAQAVCNAVMGILTVRYPGYDFTIISTLYKDFAALYSGNYPGYIACETPYHDVQHVLDVSLAMARLLDGYDKSHSSEQQLGPELAVLGMAVALFHDSGYIRSSDDKTTSHGAEYTKTHVSRSAAFMAHYFPLVAMAQWVKIAEKLVHFTGYELPPESITLANPKHRVLGAMIGTADVVAQMADAAYLNKCRDRLYPEFELGGMLKQRMADGSEQVIYSSAEDLLAKTPGFIKTTITERLDGHFQGLYRYVEAHFGGTNKYMEALENNCKHLESLLAKNDPELLKQTLHRPE
ncbi:hypothetical protein NO559_14790 [Dasania sp. GY-MA-18]|uniref:HD/PDEase domain-containing protein n=1 Tax=Dasania phycosphaerae TaxID=2950436 RepID=A0A9J6RRD4_9GAMM|nr:MULTISPECIES: hypothetical protein [Dasania]MCR8924048.1 hypothetical protein [Dasania sp. GY-MA-18]MCZ0866621.1 hypothetical protein [Dasania phycosphaerae]MCZ0870206.1 hypothetical protein [Dasania phycosphaerae]